MIKRTQPSSSSSSPPVEVQYTYNGEIINEEYLEEHPEVKSLYMPSVKVNAILAATRAATLKGMFSKIIVTEHGVKYSVARDTEAK